jgi:hypothetical protein
MRPKGCARPSLASSGVANAMLDPTLELRHGNGTTPRTEIEETTLASTNDLESAIGDDAMAGRRSLFDVRTEDRMKKTGFVSLGRVRAKVFG